MEAAHEGAAKGMQVSEQRADGGIRAAATWTEGQGQMSTFTHRDFSSSGVRMKQRGCPRNILFFSFELFIF